MAEITPNPKQLYAGMNLTSTPSQVKNGQTTYALNAVVANHDGNSVTYQNEEADEYCASFPDGYRPIGIKNIIEDGIILFWLVNPTNNGSEIGKIENCVYSTIINADCLKFRIDNPILKIVYRKNNCNETEVYWVENTNKVRWINLSQLPYKIIKGDTVCDDTITTEVDCNRLNLQPNFNIPQIDVIGVESEGSQKAGTLQFAVQYTDKLSLAYTPYYSVTNPTPMFDESKITLDFDYPVNKSVTIKISNLDVTGLYEYINLAVIKTVNNISTVELVGTYNITSDALTITYTGQSKTDIKLSPEDIFAKYDVYDNAKDITTAQNTLILANLTTTQRISYQEIASQIQLKWQTWRMPKDSFKDEIVATYLKGYMGDEVYPFEIAFLLDEGVQTDGFHIPGRAATPYDLEEISNNDVIDAEAGYCEPQNTTVPRWMVYNTASVLGYEQAYIDFLAGIKSSDCTNPKLCGIENIDPSDPECYSGPFQYGDFAYWESTDTYPCNSIYGDLSGKPIRHPKFPDSVISHIHDNQGFIYSKGIKINIQELVTIIRNSNLTDEEKRSIKGFKILRGNRANSKSVVAKGLLYNVGKYIREGETFFYPNYPFNDLREDPFIDAESNYLPSTPLPTPDPRCFEYQITITTAPATVNYVDCTNLQQASVIINTPGTSTLCSIEAPTFAPGSSGAIIPLSVCDSGGDDPVTDEKGSLNGFVTNDSKQRYTFHSPDTSFYQPFLGNILKLETAEFGIAQSHFTEVKNHAKYSFISEESVVVSLAVAVGIGFASNTVGVSTNVFNGTAAWTALQTMLELIGKLLPNKNFAYQQNSVGNYVDYKGVQNNGNKQRKIDLGFYMQPGMVNNGDSHVINNYQRESSVYLKTSSILPFPDTIAGVPQDNTRYTLSQEDICDNPTAIKNRTISAYYSSIKQYIPNQYGTLYSYETLDTGYQFTLDVFEPIKNIWLSVYGGDVFINRFGFKRKFPYFIDNRVNPEGTNLFPNNSDIFYNEIGNVGYPKYWFSTDIRKSGGGALFGLFGVKETSFDCKDNKFFYNSGKIYLFNYGIPYFYCESEVNVDLRQATNTKAGDFYPRVSSGIPDDWMQETYVSINNDNTYYYNKTYSKQNKENLFTHIPDNWDPSCETSFPFKVVFSENWRVFKPSAKFNLPNNYGSLISIDGIENKQVLVRFEQKTLLYNALLTAPTSAADVYLGQSLFSTTVPPLDYADTDIGYMGCQNKMLLKTEYGHISTDAKRGQVFLINGQSAKDLTADTETQKVEAFFNEFFNFHILSVDKNINIDNHYKDIGITGVYDTKYDRFILTKKDYKPLISGISYSDNRFYYKGKEISLTNKEYFCNYSFTISYNFKIQAWVSFHTYIPNYYIGDSNFFYAGDETSIWKHNTTTNKFNSFFGKIHPYIIEYPYSRQYNDEILQNLQDYSRIFQYTNWREFVETDDDYFNKLVIYSNQQCSGILNLVNKPKNNLSLANKYPVYNTDSKTITFTKSNSFYQVNTFWDMVVDVKKPIWTSSCENLSIFKEINQDNMDYGKRSRKKAPFRSKELKVRYILDDKDNIKIISTFTTAPTMQSYK